MTFNEAQHPRDDDGRFRPKPSPESDADLGHGDRATPPGHWTGKPFHLTVQPQAWVNDYAVDAGPAEDFDVAPVLHTMDQEQRERFLESVETGDTDDDVYLEAAADGRVSDGYGPFYITGDADDLQEWIQDNPAWEQDGETPHPTGGYVTVDVSDVRTCHLDAEGKLHREDGPSLITQDRVVQAWYQHGRMHREDGPAYVEARPGSTKEVWAVRGDEVATRETTTSPGWTVTDGRPVKLD